MDMQLIFLSAPTNDSLSSGEALGAVLSTLFLPAILLIIFPLSWTVRLLTMTFLLAGVAVALSLAQPDMWPGTATVVGLASGWPTGLASGSVIGLIANLADPGAASGGWDWYRLGPRFSDKTYLGPATRREVADHWFGGANEQEYAWERLILRIGLLVVFGASMIGILTLEQFIGARWGFMIGLGIGYLPTFALVRVRWPY